MNKSVFFPLLKKELKEQFRSGRLIVFMVLFLLFGLLSPLTAKFMPDIIASFSESQNISITLPEPGWMDAVAQYIKNLTQICTFLIIIIYMGSIAKEKETGTAVFLLSKPVSRGSFLSAKFVSVALAAFVSIVISFLAAAFYTVLFFDGFDILRFAWLNLVMLLYLISILFMVMMFSTLMRSQILAGVLSFVCWMLISLAGQLGGIGKFLPAALIGQASEAMIGNSLMWQPFAGTTLLLMIFCLLSYVAFRRWEGQAG